jgi:DUF971 family protein
MTITSLNPEAIDVNESRVKIAWNPDNIVEYTAKILRTNCHCANCISEITGEKTLDPNSITDDIQIAGAQLNGNYAISINFTDGHTTGIFTFEMMYQLEV